MDFCLAKRRVVSWGGLSEAGRRACKQRMWRAQSRSTHLTQPSFFHTYSDPHHPSRPRASTPPSHQATGITEDLYHRAYAFCTRLLTLPAPYSTVALDCAIRLKTETAVPGGSYWHPGRPVQQCYTTQYPAVFSWMPKRSVLSAPSRKGGELE